MTIKLTSDKAKRLENACQTVLNSLNSPSLSICNIAEAIDCLVVGFPGVVFGQMHYHNTELQWWVENNHTAYTLSSNNLVLQYLLMPVVGSRIKCQGPRCLE